MGRPKASLLLESGKPMIAHVYDVLRSCCASVVLAGDPPDLPPSLQNVSRVTDRFRDAGPIGGLEALLASGIDEEYLVVPCDLPSLQPATLRLVTAAQGNLPVVLATEKRLQPLIARYGAGQLPEVRKRIEQGLYSLRAMLHDIEHTRITVPAPLAYTLHNINTVRDFTNIRNSDQKCDDNA